MSDAEKVIQAIKEYREKLENMTPEERMEEEKILEQMRKCLFCGTRHWPGTWEDEQE